MYLGEVVTFAQVNNDKAQALKPLEEAAEAFGAWQAMRAKCQDDCLDCSCPCDRNSDLVDECVDVIQATVNLLAAVSPVDDLQPEVLFCRIKNERKGRKYAG